MSSPVDYDHTHPQQFGGALPEPRSFEESEALIWPVPYERTTSYVAGTRHGPRELLVASAQVELWDEEVGADVHGRGMFTLPELDPRPRHTRTPSRRFVGLPAELYDTGKFVVMLGGEHSVTSPVVAAAAARHSGLSILQIDAHADLRDSYLSDRHSHACAMRGTLEFGPLVQVGIRNISQEEVQALPSLQTTIFFDRNMRNDPAWIDRVVDSLSDVVYITIDLDGPSRASCRPWEPLNPAGCRGVS